MTWKTSKLGEVCEIIKRGIGPKYLEVGGVCVVNQKCIRDHTINYQLARRHDNEAKKVSEERYIKIGDVLVNSTGTGTLGRVAQVRAAPLELTTVDTHVTIVRPKEGVFYDDFFGYMLIKIEEAITAAGEGASGQTELARSKLENEFFVSYPESISEQKNIVTILDQAFAEIEQVRAKTEQNLKNARELFESYLQQVFSQHGDGWKKTQLGNLFDIGSSKRIYATDWKSSGVPFFGGKEIVQLAKYGTVVSNAYISEEKYIEYSSKYDMPQEGDILMTARGTIGVGYIVKKGEKFYYKDGNIISLRQKVPTNPQFILYAFKSKKIVAQIEMLTGTTVNHLPLKTAKEIVINVPNNHEQDLYVSQIKKMEFNIQQLVCTYEKKLLSIDELKKSILQNAFMGKLTKAGKPYENFNNVGNRQN